MNRNKEIMEMARRICRTSTRIMERCQRERTQSGGKLLSPTQYHLCEVVRRCQPVTVTELARQLRVTAPSASVMVERLVEQGFLKRGADKKDRRKRVIFLTPLAARMKASRSRASPATISICVRGRPRPGTAAAPGSVPWHEPGGRRPAAGDEPAAHITGAAGNKNGCGRPLSILPRETPFQSPHPVPRCRSWL
jgi:DNA-binding MarR family transcriptional regulator